MHILVTRPDPAGTELCVFLRTAGHDAVHLPTIDIVPTHDAAFLDAISKLGAQDWIIFISPQAVYTSVVTIRSIWPHFPSTVQFAAVGEGTAAALHQAGYNVCASPKTTWSSEGLLDLPVFQSIADKKVAIIRGQGGRTYLADTLRARGAQVLPVISYRRALPQINMSPFLEKMKEKKIDVIVCASFEAAQNLKALVGAAGWSYIQHIPLIVVSERIKMLAQNLQFQTIWVAKNASHTAILACIKHKGTNND